MILGVDPGKNGGWALLDERGRLGSAEHYPIGEDGEIDAAELHATWSESATITRAFVERVGSMGPTKDGRKQGLQGMFNFGRRHGTVLAVLQILGIPVTFVEPSVWKRATGVTAVKGTSLAAARKLWPYAAGDIFKLKQDEARAEAALIARFGMLTTYSHRRAP